MTNTNHNSILRRTFAVHHRAEQVRYELTASVTQCSARRGTRLDTEGGQSEPEKEVSEGTAVLLQLILQAPPH